MRSSGSLSLSRYELPLGPAPLPMILLIPCPELSFRQVNWAVCTWGKRDSYFGPYGSRLDEHTLTDGVGNQVRWAWDSPHRVRQG